MELTFKELRRQNVQRCEVAFHPLAAWSPADWAVAVGGELGEAMNLIKKLRRHADGTNTAKDPPTAHAIVALIADELADTVIYTDLLAARLGINLEEAVRDKFNAVSKLRKVQIWL